MEKKITNMKAKSKCVVQVLYENKKKKTYENVILLVKFSNLIFLY